MRVKDIDCARWAQISREIDALCDEIAGNNGIDGPWSGDQIEVQVWENLNRAAVLATLHAAFPSVTMTQMRNLVRGDNAS